MQLPRPRGNLLGQLFEALEPGRAIEQGAGRFGEALLRSQDPRGPIRDAAWAITNPIGRMQNKGPFDVQAQTGVMNPMMGNPVTRAMGEPLLMERLGEAFEKFEPPAPINARMKQSIRGYGSEEFPRPMPNANELRYRQVANDTIDAELDKGISPIEGLLEKIRPKQGKQLGIFDDEFQSPDELPSFNVGKVFAQGPLEGKPGFRPINASPLEREEWYAEPTRDVGGKRLPGLSPRSDALGQMKRYGYDRVDNQQLRRVRDDLRSRKETGVDRMPPPPDPRTYSEHYYKGAELNFVPKPRPRKGLVEQYLRLAGGNRGGV